MKKRLINSIVKLSYYPRKVFDSFLYLFLKSSNDWSLLEPMMNKDVLIVGNGPSLNKTPLEKIDMISIGMNKINLIFNRTTWKPNIIVCINGLVIKQNKSFFNTTNIPVILPVNAFYLGIKNRPNIFFIRILNSEQFFDKIEIGVGKGNTVTYTAFQIASYLKASSINIVGVDHYFKYDGANKIDKLEGNDLNHFDPNYFKNQLWGLPDIEGSERVYRYARDYFESQKVSVVDYTINGKLEVFSKGKIEDLINK